MRISCFIYNGVLHISFFLIIFIQILTSSFVFNFYFIVNDEIEVQFLCNLD